MGETTPHGRPHAPQPGQDASATTQQAPAARGARRGALGQVAPAGRKLTATNPALGGAVQATEALTDKDASGVDKAAAVGQVAAEVIGTAVATPVVGKIAGYVAGTRPGRAIMGAIAAVLAVGFVAQAVLLLLGVQSVAALIVTQQADDTGGDSDLYCWTPSSATGDTSTLLLSGEQTANATTIITTVMGRNLTAADAVIAVMTALTESGLRNISYGDQAGPDSRGLFQQRDSWGALEVRMDPAGATGLFLDRLTAPGLKVYGTGTLVNATPGSRAQVEPWMAAQSVQISAFADGANYQRSYSQAVTIVRAVLGDAAGVLNDPWRPPSDAGPVSGSCANGSTGATLAGGAAVQAALAFAYRQVGAPYVWGAAGPQGFDCSGLTMRAYGAAGIDITRTSRSQYAWGMTNKVAVPLAQRQPGDLIFWAHDPSNPTTIYHVALVVDFDTILQAPVPGLNVSTHAMFGAGDLMAYVVRPGALSASTTTPATTSTVGGSS